MNQESQVPNDDKETTSKATNTSNHMPSMKLSDTDDETGITYAVALTICRNNCFNDSNYDKCVNDCMKQHGFV